MQGFNPELKIGMQAMIIGCKQPKNTWVIGKMVTIESLHVVGEQVPDQYLSDSFKENQQSKGSFTVNVAIVSGVHTNESLLENHAVINQAYLMPLPPLDDDAIIFADENVKETEKCS